MIRFVSFLSDRHGAGFAGADAVALFEIEDEYFAVVDAVGSGSGDDRVETQ